jgi:hypothetical protein
VGRQHVEVLVDGGLGNAFKLTILYLIAGHIVTGDENVVTHDRRHRGTQVRLDGNLWLLRGRLVRPGDERLTANCALLHYYNSW